MEVKKRHGVDPLVQLGIWTAAGFIKRRRDGDMRNLSCQDLQLSAMTGSSTWAY